MFDSRCPVIMEQLANAVKRERRAIGYPDRCGKITYSTELHALAVKALALSHISLSDLAKRSDLSPLTLQKWCNQSSGFRELQMLPESVEMHSREIDRPKGNDSIEFALPLGIRIVIEQKITHKTFGVFFRSRS